MKIQLNKISIRDLTEDYNNNLEEGVVDYAGKLDIRPSYQIKTYIQNGMI